MVAALVLSENLADVARSVKLHFFAALCVDLRVEICRRMIKCVFIHSWLAV